MRDSRFMLVCINAPAVVAAVVEAVATVLVVLLKVVGRRQTQELERRKRIEKT